MGPETKPHPLEGLEWQAAQAIILARLRANEPCSPAVVRTILIEFERTTEELLQLRQERDGLRAGLAIAVDLLEELQHAWEIGQGYHQEEDPQRCPDPVCDGFIGLNADLDVEHADGCRHVQLRNLAGMEG